MEDHEHGSDESSFENPFEKDKRKMEPLFIGDKIEYREPIEGWRTWNILKATVTSIDRKKREREKSD